MIKSIINGLGAIATGAAKIASAINKSKAFKALKFFASATVGIPLALVGTAITSVAWAGIKVAGLLDAKIVKGVFGSSIWEDTAWASSLESTEKFMRSMWEDFGVYAHLKAAKFIGDQWAERQSEAGYGNAVDDAGNIENFVAVSVEESAQEEQAKIEPIRQDSKVLSSPGTSPSNPSGLQVTAKNTSLKEMFYKTFRINSP
jgi:hypothetical protein